MQLPTNNPSSFSRLLAATALVAVLSLTAQDAQARTRNVNTTGARGGTATRQVDRASGSVSRSSSATSADGTTASHQYQRSVDAATGDVSTSASTTLPDGRTASRSLNSTKTDTGRTTTAQATGPNGQTATLNSTTTKTDTGYVRETTATAPDGSSVSTQATVSKEGNTTTRTVSREKKP